MELNEGDKYLSIRISVGLAQQEIFKAVRDGKENIDLVAFKNKDHEKNLQSPHYRKGEIAVWINKKKNKNETEQ